MALIHNDWTWDKGVIIEGVNILPELAAKEQAKHDYVQSIFLSDQNIQRTHDVIHKRGLFGKADSYSDDVKGKEIEWVHLFDDKIRSEAKLYNLPVVDLDKDENDIQKIIDILK